MTDPTPVEAVRTFLLGTAAVSAQVGTRIWVPELPDNEAASMPRKCAVINIAGGAGLGARDYSPLHEQRMDVKCYGATFAEAEDVWQVIYRTLKAVAGEAVGTGLIHTVTIESNGMMLRDADGRWPMLLGVVNVRTAEQVLT